MKIETEILENHSAKLTVELNIEQMQNAMQRAARKIARRIKIPGFRPGKAPYQVILRQVGEGTVKEEAIEILVDEIYPRALDEASIKPYGPGRLENITLEDAPILEFIVPIQAEVILGDYLGIRKPYEPTQITDTDVDKVLVNLQDRHAILEPVEREIQEGDLTTIIISAVRSVVDDDQDPVLFKEQSLPLIILPESQGDEESRENEDNDVEEWPFPGFSRNLIGLSPNEEKSIEYTYSDESSFEDLRGISAQFHVKIDNIKSRSLPELNDEFAATLGEYDNLMELKSEIRSSLEEQALQEYNTAYDNEILQDAIEQANIAYPSEMLEHEIDDVIKRLESRLEQQNMNLELYLKTRDQDENDLREEFQPIAESRLKNTLVLLEIAKKEDIQLDQAELRSETKSTLDMLANVLPKKDARRLSNEGIYQNIMGNIMEDMLTRKAMERLRDISSGKLEEFDEESGDEFDNVEDSSEDKVTQLTTDEVEPDVLLSDLNNQNQED